MSTPVYTPTVGLKDYAPHPTLEAAFRLFHDKITEYLNDRETVSHQWLSTCWIQSSDSPLPITFDQVVEVAHECGWMKDGELVES